jgi:hypothetical protein
VTVAEIYGHMAELIRLGQQDYSVYVVLDEHDVNDAIQKGMSTHDILFGKHTWKVDAVWSEGTVDEEEGFAGIGASIEYNL